MITNPYKLPQAEHTQTQYSEKFLMWPIILLSALFVIACCLLIFYFANFNEGVPNQEKFGQFGDYLGGVLNPVLGFATVGLLIWSLRMQREELALTRKELEETKKEIALSRKAMEAQVTHLEKEAKLNEALRIIADLRTHISIISNYKFVLSRDVAHEIVSALSTYGTTADDVRSMTATTMNALIYGERKSLFENNENIRAAFKEQFDSAIQNNEPSPLVEFEKLLLQLSTVAMYYHQESHSKKLTLVYLLEAERLLKPFQGVVSSKILQSSIDKLNLFIKLAINND
ncbi:hypothetical protein HGO26_11085 [Shewanella sp. S-1]|uniref:Uncharacterized protein n=1 Tax=Shewanella oncorhynchi TaxID=2726434 RepID=A0ABX1KPD1_9GAMM|nr:hypothetical protein [Shewanella oncorhynchi]NLQ23416.1 hypothetical protein [Shewanella oncorhynchi]